MTDTLNITKGAKLWYVSCGCCFEGEVEITSVGRKWAKLNKRADWQVDRITGVVSKPGYGKVGDLYASREAWQAQKALENAWRDFVNEARNRYRMPPRITLDRIRQLREMMGIPKAQP